MNNAIRINPFSLCAIAEAEYDSAAAARLSAILPTRRAEIMGTVDVTTTDVVEYLRAARPESPDAAIVAAYNGIPMLGCRFSKYVTRRFESHPDSVRDDAADIIGEVTALLAGERVQGITPDPRVAVVVCMSRGLYRAYLRVDGSLCEPSSPMAHELGAGHWAPAFCRNLNRVLNETQGAILGDDGVEEYLDSMEDRELVDAIAAGAVMDDHGRIPGYGPDFWILK